MANNTNKSRESYKLSSIRDKDNLGFTKIKNDKDNSAVLQTNYKHKRFKSSKTKSNQKHAIVRVMDRGQFNVSIKTAKKINQLDNSLVDIIKRYELQKREFRKKLTQMISLVANEGKPLDDKEIVQSDIILPATDISIEEARKLFTGEGVIPETLIL